MTAAGLNLESLDVVVSANGDTSKKAPYQDVEDFVRTHAPVWQRHLGLTHYEIEHVFLDSYFGDDGEEDFKITACTETRWNYFLAKIKWYLPAAVRHPKEHLEKVLVHELCHVLLAAEQSLLDARMEEAASSGELHTQGAYDSLEARFSERLEFATEMVTRAIWSMHCKG